jgi:para-nitrobenzyl esterase
MTSRGIWVGLGATLALTLTACGSGEQQGKEESNVATQSESADMTVATTAYGKVLGDIEGGVVVFKGIPYGASTAGENRFMPPKPPAAWSDVRDALKFGDQCPQTAPPPTAAFASWGRDVGQSEDCLVLNVWTPAVDDQKRPVMVWFHGGGFAVFDGSAPVYDSPKMVKRGDVVVVTLNHRLNLFGYMYLGGVGGEKYANSANLGQQDLVAALKWVRDNIANFGGDPNNVMIFGESGGGAKVSNVLAMPSAKNLFNKAAIESGPGLTAQTVEQANELAGKFLSNLNLTDKDIDKLQTLPASDLLDAMKKMTGGMPIAGFGPVVDGTVLPRQPFTPDAPSVSADVPVIVGYNATETTVLFPTPGLFTLDWDSLKKALAPQMPGKDVDAVIVGMRKLIPDATPSDIYFIVTTERGMGAGSYLLASRKAALGAAPAYVYRLEWKTPVEDGKLHSPHALDLPMVFDTVDKSAAMIGDGTEEAQKVADTMSAFWVSFARDGDPNGPGLPEWPAYDDTKKATMVFNVESRAKDDPVGDIRAIVLDK